MTIRRNETPGKGESDVLCRRLERQERNDKGGAVWGKGEEEETGRKIGDWCLEKGKNWIDRMKMRK